MMNNLFQDLINQEDTATFIDDILVATDTEEGHNDITNGHLLFVMGALIL